MASTSTPHHLGTSTKFIKDGGQGWMRIPPKDLNIVWGRDDRYWDLNLERNMDGDSPAELHQVSWLEVTCTVEETSPSKNYVVGFLASLKIDAFGWSKCPVYILAKRGKHGKYAFTKNYINPNQEGVFEIKGRGRGFPMGENLDPDSDNGMLYFGLYEVWSGKWKGGLNIHHAFVHELP